MPDTNNYLELPAIKIVQPLGEFYAVVFKAKELKMVSFSEPATLNDELDTIEHTQRVENINRLKEIGKYIDTVDSAFPNAIILGANYNNRGEHVTDEAIKWKVKHVADEYFRLIIPKQMQIASIIDGQHRLHGFEYSGNPTRENMELLCSVYLDIPVPYHAYIFSTINFNQKKVDKSLAYNLFGFDIESSPSDTWAPETLAIFLSRKLNTEEDGPFCGHIKLGVQNDSPDEAADRIEENWAISMATIVDGILGLITTNPKKDRYELMKVPIDRGRNRSLLDKSGPPLRFLYLNEYDKALYEILSNYFMAVKDVFWENINSKSYIRKTVGIQALFDVLKILMADFETKKQAGYDHFKNIISIASSIDFTKMEASGIGKTKIKNAILLKLEYIDIESIKEADRPFYLELLA
ncbi:MAG: DNA phosphorothioation-associated DGQHR protein 1 [Geobacteraceae bacterium]|nr:DNA phosphorothioation-associated DGQHR protein 1 [Geobacteraceae bacterium]